MNLHRKLDLEKEMRTKVSMTVGGMRRQK